MKIRAVIFIALISLVGLATLLFFPTEEIVSVYAGYGGGVRGLLLTAMDHTTLTNKLNENVVLHDRWIDLFGGMQRAAGVDTVEDRDNPVYRLRNNRVTFVYTDTSPFSDEERESIYTFKQSADGVSARTIFVTIPQKTCSRQSDFMTRGVQTHSEEIDAYRAGVFAEAGFEILDLHEKMHSEGKDHAAMYFRTDHHWTAHAGLWAAKEIGDALGLDTTLLDPSQFTTEKHPGIFLGSEGKHGGRLYCPPDDLDILTPTFDTALTHQIEQDTLRSGSFREGLLFPEQLKPARYEDYFPYSIYLNGDHSFSSIQNTQNPDGMRVLLIKDSFSNSMAPYLALCCAQVDMIDTRFYASSAAAYVAQSKPDAVCVALSARTNNEDFDFNSAS